MADAALEGAQAYNTRATGFAAEQDNWRKQKAMDALTNIYGPIAGDPTDAQANQNYLTSTQMDPLKVQAAQNEVQAGTLANQGTEIKNRTAGSNQDNAAALRAAQFLKLHANPDGSLNPDAVSSVLTPENAQLFGMDPAHLEPMKQLLSTPNGAGAIDHIISALQSGGSGQLQGSVQYGTDPHTGAPVEILHTKSGQTIVRPISGGATPTILTNAGTAAFRADTGRQNAGTAAFNAGVKANNSEFGAPDGAVAPGAAPPAPAVAAPAAPAAPTKPTGGLALTPASIKQFIQSNGSVDAAIAATATMPRAAGDAAARAIADYASKNPSTAAAPAKPVANTIPPDSLFAKLPPKGRQEAVGGATALANQATNLQTINTLLDSVDHQIGSYTAAGGSLLNRLPGTAATDLKANLTSLKAAGLTAWINSLKNTKGQTGIGRVLQSEATAATSIFGNMEQDQTADALRFHAQLFRRAVNNLYQHAQDGYHAQWGVTPDQVLGTPPLSTTPVAPARAAPLSDADLFKKYGIK